MKKVIIIGAGIGGLATACLLAKRGYDVHIYEKQSQVGGRAGQLQSNGFTFDTGPSWYLMPEVFEQFYQLLGLSIHDHLRLTRLDPAYKVMFEGEPQSITIHADIEKDAATFESIETGSAKQLRRYLAQSERTYIVAVKHFLYTNFNSLKPFLQFDVILCGPRMLRAAFQPIDSYVSKYFKDWRLKQIMEYPMVFLGTSPFEAPAIYSLMSHMDFNQGVYYPQGGLYEIIRSLESIARDNGVTIHTQADVHKIMTTDSHATGIQLLDGSTVDADIVISNADLHFTETQLLDKSDQTYPEAFWKNRQPSPSAILLYLGIKGRVPELEHHNLLFTRDWKYNFGLIFNEKQWPTPASMYLCMPSKTDSSVAPADHENIFVLVPGPARTNDSAQNIEALADAYLDQIVTMTGIHDLKERIVEKHIVSPRDFADSLHSWNGAALGLSHTLNQSALFRPQNKSRRLDNLYYVGGTTVPGIGLPMCLISAQLIDKRLRNDRSSGAITSLDSSEK